MKMSLKFKTIAVEVLRGLGPPAVVFIWTYYFWGPISKTFSLLSAVEIVIVVLVAVFAGCVDALVSWKSERIAMAILVSYGSWVLILLILLTVASDRLAGSGLIGLYLLATFLVLRGSAQLQESDILHWKRPACSESGLAVTSVLILDRPAEPLQFVLVKNENLNNGRGLWVAPGTMEPDVVVS